MSYALKAEKLARQFHEGQFRKDGKTPYIEHSKRVVNFLKNLGFGDDYITVAWIHDVLEDTDCTEENLLQIFPQYLIYSVKVLTKRKWENYIDYIYYVMNDNDISKIVKFADILDNLSDCPTQKQKEKYKQALAILGGLGYK